MCGKVSGLTWILIDTLINVHVYFFNRNLVDPDLDANRFDKQFWLVSDSIDADQTVLIVLPAVTFVICK